jgi:hypothetical protein
MEAPVEHLAQDDLGCRPAHLGFHREHREVAEATDSHVDARGGDLAQPLLGMAAEVQGIRELGENLADPPAVADHQHPRRCPVGKERDPPVSASFEEIGETGMTSKKHRIWSFRRHAAGRLGSSTRYAEAMPDYS